VRRLERRPGQKEDRFEHLFGGASEEDAAAGSAVARLPVTVADGQARELHPSPAPIATAVRSTERDDLEARVTALERGLATRGSADEPDLATRVTSLEADLAAVEADLAARVAALEDDLAALRSELLGGR